MKIFDISVSIDTKLPLWPNSSGLRVARMSNIGKRTKVNESHIEMNVHVGTHIDAPLHFVLKGKSIDQAELETFIGDALVIHLPKVKAITAKDLEKLSLPRDIRRMLFKTSNSNLWNTKKFNKNYVGLTADAAKWLVKKGVRLVGIDYLSIAKFEEAVEVHQILLGKNIYILESVNLSKVKAGIYKLICLPIKLTNAEAAPARAVLISK